MICLNDLKVGDKVRIRGEKLLYTVQARDERYIICTKPFNIKHTVLYFILDLKQGIRGPDNMVFCMGYETRDQCQERLKDLQRGYAEVSLRRCVPLGMEC